VPARLEAALSPAWIAALAIGAATVAIKATGPVLLAGRELPRRLLGVVGLLAPALLAALVVTQAVAGDRRYVFDARLLGLAAAAVAIRLRAPLLAVVVLSAAVTALARAL
jgi:branched-subunit amino acid transport protein